MNKCLIYMYYDRDGLVRKSTLQLLDEFHKIVDYIYFVSNNELHNKNQIIASVDDLIIRKNEGYDAGAYRDVLLNNNVDRWDQIIFCNNTFWGPFVALDSLFQKMDETNADYWGLSYSGKNLIHHVQSYFMVFNKKVIPELKKYFVEYISPGKQSYREICTTFELGLNDYLLKKGFKYRAYSDNIAYDPYSDPYGSVKYDDLPILKKKIFEENFEIKSVPASSRRSLFNPLIIGKFSSKSNKTVLSINMKLPSSDYIFIGMFFVLCVFFGAIIYSCSLDNSNLVPLIFILPFTFFLRVNVLFFFFAKMNFSDAIYNIENILKECIIIDDKAKP